MKTTLLFFLFFTTFYLSAQRTYNLDWQVGQNGDAASLTILTGDTVVWTMTDDLRHTITSLAGSTETFDSGTLSKTGETFSHTFNLVGVNDYQCYIHPRSMFGTITVENSLGESKHSLNEFRILENPSKNRLSLQLPSFSNDMFLEVFDVLGKKVYSKAVNGLTYTIDVSKWNIGVYLVRVTTDKSTQTKRFVKQ